MTPACLFSIHHMSPHNPLTLQLQVSQTGVERVNVITGVSLKQKVLHASGADTVLGLQGGIVHGWHLSSHG